MTVTRRTSELSGRLRARRSAYYSSCVGWDRPVRNSSPHAT